MLGRLNPLRRTDSDKAAEVTAFSFKIQHTYQPVAFYPPVRTGNIRPNADPKQIELEEVGEPSEHDC